MVVRNVALFILVSFHLFHVLVHVGAVGVGVAVVAFGAIGAVDARFLCT